MLISPIYATAVESADKFLDGIIHGMMQSGREPLFCQVLRRRAAFSGRLSQRFIYFFGKI